MRTISVILSLLILQGALIWNVLATSPLDVDIGLYHSVHQNAAAPKCTAIKLPTDLCTKCKLKPFTGKGDNLNFGGVNRFDIYDLSDKECMESLKEYLKKNPCDEMRADALKTYETKQGKQKANAYKVLIYFMYSVCETCCDCIPIGAKITNNDYEKRKKNKTLINIKRGNCAAHFHYDTCRIWPNVGLITSGDGSTMKKKFPWCGHFKNWLASPDSKGWLKNNNAKGLTWRMRRGMDQLMENGMCTDKTQWENCVRMEKAQNRV